MDGNGFHLKGRLLLPDPEYIRATRALLMARSTGGIELNSSRSAAPVSGWRLPICLLALSVLPASHAVAQPAEDRVGIDAAVRGFMERSGAPGVAVGVVTPAGRRFFWYGVASKETRRPVDERTLFEIGSISKTFAATLAAYAAETGAL